MKTCKTLVKTGDLVQVNLYTNAIQYGQKRIIVPTIKQKKEAVLLARQSCYRAKDNMRRLIIGNMHTHKEKAVFLTLTFKENITELSRANKQFRYFIKRMNGYLGYPFRYVAVPEFQMRGAVHYHMIVFNMPFIKGEKIEHEIWKNGATNIKLLKKGHGAFHYITKYMNKNFFDERYRNKKRYFSSVENRPVKYLPQIYADEFQGHIDNYELTGDTVITMKDKSGFEVNTVRRLEYFRLGQRILR